MDKCYTEEDTLFADIEKAIDDALEKEVFEAARNTELKHIESDVMNVYDPYIYERRSNGGIDDPNNIVGTVENGRLEVENVTTFNPGYNTTNQGIGLADLINGGDGTDGYQYDYAYRYRVPYTMARPFIDNTIDELDKSDICENALANGLKRQGINLE